jgi:hypothetical protein
MDVYARTHMHSSTHVCMYTHIYTHICVYQRYLGQKASGWYHTRLIFLSRALARALSPARSLSIISLAHSLALSLSHIQQERKLLVRYLGRKSGEMTPLRRLNALQYIDGKVYAFGGRGG